MAAYYGVKPQPMFVEGGSQFVYMPCVPRELIRLPGRRCISRRTGITRLLTIRTSRVEVGNTNPMLEGSLFTSLSYRGFTLNVTAAYKFWR